MPYYKLLYMVKLELPSRQKLPAIAAAARRLYHLVKPFSSEKLDFKWAYTGK
jgi:hypothetical protein